MEEDIEHCSLSVLVYQPICLLTVHMGLPNYHTAYMQGGLNHEQNVHLSICLSACQTREL